MSVKQIIEAVKSDYENVREVGNVLLFEKGSKHKDYVTQDEVPLIANFSLGSKANKHGLTKNAVRSTISAMVYSATNNYEYELTHREAEMLKKVELVSLIDHENGYVELMLYSTKLNYSVGLLVSERYGQMKRGTITG